MFSIKLDEIDKAVESHVASVDRARRQVAEVASEGKSYKVIADALNDLAEAEGACYAVRILAHVLGEQSTEAVPTRQDAYREALSLLLEAMVPGAEDTWSGRTNDVRRAYHDGFRGVVNDVRFELVRGVKA